MCIHGGWFRQQRNRKATDPFSMAVTSYKSLLVTYRHRDQSKGLSFVRSLVLGTTRSGAIFWVRSPRSFETAQRSPRLSPPSSWTNSNQNKILASTNLLLGFLLDPEDVGNMLLRNIAVLQLRRLYSELQGFWTFSIVRNSKYTRTQRFGD
jgi:hypothetical protein